MKNPLLKWVASIALAALGVGRVYSQSEVLLSYDNVVIVLDASGSMEQPLSGTRGTKMAAAKVALGQVLQQIPASTHVGLLVFSGTGLRDPWVYPLGPRNDAELSRAIELPQPYGDTPLGKYIKLGADRLLQERAKQLGYGTFRLLIVTDGEAQDQALVDRYTPEVIARGITVDVIGVGMNRRHTLATRVHSYRPANDAASLKRAIAEVFAEVGGRGKDQLDAEAFAILAPIPQEMVVSLIQALAGSGNHPIGESPRSESNRPENAGNGDASATAQGNPAGTGPSASTAAAPPMPGPSSKPGFRLGPFGWAVVFFVLAVFARARRRR